jgi:hypothetical protein
MDVISVLDMRYVRPRDVAEWLVKAATIGSSVPDSLAWHTIDPIWTRSCKHEAVDLQVGNRRTKTLTISVTRPSCLVPYAVLLCSLALK